MRSQRLLIFSVPNPPQNLGGAHHSICNRCYPTHRTITLRSLSSEARPAPLLLTPSSAFCLLVVNCIRAHTQAYSDVMSSNLVETMPTQWKSKYAIALIHLLKNSDVLLQKEQSEIQFFRKKHTGSYHLPATSPNGSSHNFTLSLCC